MFLIIVIIIVFVVLLIFWSQFRSWLASELDAQWTLFRLRWPVIAGRLQNLYDGIVTILGVYGLIVALLSVIALILILLGLIINKPAFTGFSFVFALILVLLAWMPSGIVLLIFGITKTVLPKTLKTFVAWIAFIGFSAMTFPEIISFNSLMGLALISFVILGVTAKINFLDKVVPVLIILMILITVWKNYFPNGYESTTRYALSWGKKINTHKDRGSINNETDAATTYAAVLKDVAVLYLRNGQKLDIVKKRLFRGTIVRLVNHKDEVFIYDGQGLVQIQLERDNGSFIEGSKYWIEAEYVQIASPRAIVSKDDSLLPGKQKKNESRIQAQSLAVRDSFFTSGTYYIDVNNEAFYYINILSTKTCARYSLASQTGNGYFVIYDDGPPVYDEPGINTVFPNKERPRFKLKSKQPATIKMVVS